MKKARKVITCASGIALVGTLVASCTSSQHAAVPSAGEPWARSLTEPPPQRASTDDEVARAKADLTAARERAQR